ncbi:lytic transglycosylase domain-containing protein [Lichenihabitans sp. Uapishka_5]|uniref:lytic murein transglycosylase n=1 Tax=Lichenihabitans sp. Uapishka_5 TaxID=3037302 RepID=UPI0029E7F4F3|nr:lytic transglycosylase domain-containing protein [Lichenihabitans sp. Uapishka_5]MDX7951924.1 lytic transglycosylase domain-containing protein [Lichenihabitans sp. Uapishka_5]
MSSSLFRTILLSTVLATGLGNAAHAAQCGNTGAGFDSWKQQFSEEARAHGVGEAGLAALADTHYNGPTIAADRGQHSFKLSLDQFMAKRGGSVIVSQGRRLKQTDASMFASIEDRYGVPPGPLLAIWGMETGFGKIRGNQEIISATATLAYDCRRTAYFTDQLYAALELVDKGVLQSGTRGSMHGEVGHTQFLPKNILQYGVGGSLDVAQNALASTANFLKAHGWQRGAGYQPGEPNFAAIQAWNAATVYEQSIALIGGRIDAN